MGTLIVSLVLLMIVGMIIKSIIKKHKEVKRTGSCCCGCSGCGSDCKGKEEFFLKEC